MFWRQFQATAKLRAVSCTSFSFLTIRAILRQNDSSEVRFPANFKQQPSGAVLHKFYLRQQIEVSCILLTKLSHSGKFKVARSFSPGTVKFSVARPFSHKLYVTPWEYFFRLLFSLGFWQKTQISSNSDLHTPLYTSLANLKMSFTFLT